MRILSCLLFIVILLMGSAVLHVEAVNASSSSELLTKPWRLSAFFGASERYQLVDPNILKGVNTLRLTYDLHGTCLLSGDASALIFDQPINKSWRYISLSKYGKNCYNGQQIVDIPLSQFPNLNLSLQVGTFHIRIWKAFSYTVEITSAIVYSSSSFGSISTPAPTSIPTATVVTSTPTRTPTRIPSSTPTMSPMPTAIPPTLRPSVTIPPTPTATLTPKPSLTATPIPTSTPLPASTIAPLAKGHWSIQSVSSMKETKDRICSPRSADFISKWLDKAVTLGTNYVAVETPYDNPGCGDSVAYAKSWAGAVHARGLNVWHRHMPLAFEGIYSTPKSISADYLTMISNYIKANPTLFAAGDIFTPIPEPQNGGIAGVTYCPQNICMFSSAAGFNKWLRDAMDISEQAFASIGLGGKMKIGYFGFDGFVAWGDNNPDWNGILEDATVVKMGNITIDHYPEIVNDTMKNDLDELEHRYPNIPIIIGEWGTITGGDTRAQVQTSMAAAKRPSVVGFNYWHQGVGGNEQLIDDQFVEQPQYSDVQMFFKGLN